MAILDAFVEDCRDGADSGPPFITEMLKDGHNLSRRADKQPALSGM